MVLISTFLVLVSDFGVGNGENVDYKIARVMSPGAELNYLGSCRNFRRALVNQDSSMGGSLQVIASGFTGMNMVTKSCTTGTRELAVKNLACRT